MPENRTLLFRQNQQRQQHQQTSDPNGHRQRQSKIGGESLGRVHRRLFVHWVAELLSAADTQPMPVEARGSRPTKNLHTSQRR